jgi:N-formylglutamate deformylase
MPQVYKKYPLLISIPHGGTMIPPEAEGKILLHRNDLIEDSDAFTVNIFDIGNTVQTIISTDIFRAVVDPNRSRDDLPPGNPDGVIKSHTCYNKKIYRKDYHNDVNLIDKLLTKYYDDYHCRLQRALCSSNIIIAFDCHSMAPVAPALAPDAGMDRPLVTLGNNFGRACDYPTTERLANAFREVFNLEEDQVTVNKPFAGGYITRRYGNNPVPWIQIELNRCLYLNDRWFTFREINNNRLVALNSKFRRVVEFFFEKS